MLVKICGLREKENIMALAALQPAMMGFIFYQPSKRFVGEDFEISAFDIPTSIKKVGVFVDAPKDTILATVQKHKLDFVQLHGHESAVFCASLHALGIKIIKCISVSDATNFEEWKNYLPYVEYFLLDTFTNTYGGSGNTFDWNILKNYHLPKPFLLSGGISVENVSLIKALHHPLLSGIDVNSKMEIAPGLKDIEKCTLLLKSI